MKTLKKISLKGISETLSEKELKNVLGGGGDYSGYPGTCGWSGNGVTICGIPKADALSLLNSHGGHWCCDSCGSSTYC